MLMVEGCTAAVGAALSALSALSSGNEEEDNFTAVSALSKATWRGSTVSFKTFVPWRGKKREKKKKDGGANKQTTVVSMLAKTKKVQKYNTTEEKRKKRKKRKILKRTRRAKVRTRLCVVVSKRVANNAAGVDHVSKRHLDERGGGKEMM